MESKSVVKVRETRHHDMDLSLTLFSFLGGWRDSRKDMPTDAAAQIDNAFANIE